MKSIWLQLLAWLVAVMLALLLAFAAPNESAVMGRLPAVSAKRLNQQPISLPQELPAVRTLALVAFDRAHRAEVESWITGMQLRENNAIPWFKMPVFDDPGSESARSRIESQMRARHSAETDRARLVPVFTNRETFIRAAGMTGSDHAWALVLGRDGQVLARAEGQYTQEKGAALRQTLLGPTF